MMGRLKCERVEDKGQWRGQSKRNSEHIRP